VPWVTIAPERNIIDYRRGPERTLRAHYWREYWRAESLNPGNSLQITTFNSNVIHTRARVASIALDHIGDGGLFEHVAGRP
jgi:hypothetical protein